MTKKKKDKRPTPTPGVIDKAEPAPIEKVLAEAKAQPTKVEPVVKPERITKKSICLEMVCRDGGATIEEMAQEIARRGVDANMEANRSTAQLWMSKLPITVVRDRKTDKFFKETK